MSRKKTGKYRGRRARLSRENLIAMVAITIVVALLFTVLLLEGFRLNRRIEANQAHQEELSEQIASEEQRTESIEALREYMQSEEYIRQAAKDHLGLVESDEVVFKTTP